MPPCQSKIALRPVDRLAQSLVIHGANYFSGDPGYDRARGDLLVFPDDRSGRHDASGADSCARQNDGPDADQRPVSDFPSVDHGMMPQRHVPSDRQIQTGIAMEDAQILDVRVFADRDRRKVAANHRTVPDTAALRKADVAHDLRRVGDVVAAAIDQAGHGGRRSAA